MDIVVADATPLIVLGRLDLLNSIAGLFKAVYVTPGVVQECTNNITMPGAVKIASALEQGILSTSSDFDTAIS